jgi:predicted RNA-binding protein associated with RNAse of E/G family
MWTRGDVITVQDVWRGRLWAARPVFVVDDRPDLLVLWCPIGTSRKVPAGIRVDAAEASEGRGDRLARLLAAGDWLLEDSIWDVSSLWLVREGDSYATWVSFLETGSHFGWYINFQTPYTRTARTIQTMDLALDLVVEPDRSSWRWKDEDEFELFQERRLIEQHTAQHVRDQAASLAVRIPAGAPPFDDAWVGWRPDPAWGVPELPDGWDVL